VGYDPLGASFPYRLVLAAGICHGLDSLRFQLPLALRENIRAAIHHVASHHVLEHAVSSRHRIPRSHEGVSRLPKDAKKAKSPCCSLRSSALVISAGIGCSDIVRPPFVCSESAGFDQMLTPTILYPRTSTGSTTAVGIRTGRDRSVRVRSTGKTSRWRPSAAGSRCPNEPAG
jgi:hypothetical protein